MHLIHIHKKKKKQNKSFQYQYIRPIFTLDLKKKNIEFMGGGGGQKNFEWCQSIVLILIIGPTL